jgi:hypothetical protein
MGICHGNGPTHCCYVNGIECQYLVKDINSRKWSCGLLVQYGDWDSVHSSEPYLDNVRPHWVANGTPDCGTWIGPGCCFGATLDDPAVAATYVDAVDRPGTPVEVRTAILDAVPHEAP